MEESSRSINVEELNKDYWEAISSKRGLLLLLCMCVCVCVFDVFICCEPTQRTNHDGVCLYVYMFSIH